MNPTTPPRDLVVSQPAPDADGQAPLLDVRGLTVRYAGGSEDDLPAVDDAHLTVAPGQFLSIVGESGSGKSTLIRAILGVTPESAQVTADGVRLLVDGSPCDLHEVGGSRLRRVRRSHIGFVPQSTSSALNPVISVWKHFRHALRGLDRGEVRLRARRALEQVGFHDADRVLSSYAHQLSGGMLQRVVLAVAIVREPELVVADEPTTGLDLAVQRQLMEHLRSLADDRGRGVVFVSHDLGLVEEFATDVAVMYRGRIVEHGPTRSVMTDPEHAYTWSLIQSIPQRGMALRPPAAPRPQHVVDRDTCGFADRCPFLSAEATVPERTQLTEIAPGHRVAPCCGVQA